MLSTLGFLFNLKCDHVGTKESYCVSLRQDQNANCSFILKKFNK